MTDQYKFMCKLFKDLTQDLKDRLGYVFKIQHKKNCYQGYDFDPENYNKLEVKFENMEVDFEHNCYQLDKTGFNGNPWSNSTSPLEDIFVSFYGLKDFYIGCLLFFIGTTCHSYLFLL